MYCTCYMHMYMFMLHAHVHICTCSCRNYPTHPNSISLLSTNLVSQDASVYLRSQPPAEFFSSTVRNVLLVYKTKKTSHSTYMYIQGMSNNQTTHVQ